MTAVLDTPRPAVRAGKPPGAMELLRPFLAELEACCMAPGPAADRLTDGLRALTDAAAGHGPAAHGATVKAVFALAMLADRALAQTRPAEAVVAQRLFGTNSTLQILFVQADDLIRLGDRADRDLASVYLAVLSLGFVEDADAAARRPSLHRIVAGERNESARPSPRAYEPPAGAIPGEARPSARRWWWALGAVAATFLLASHLLWTDATADLAADLRGARAAIEDMGLSWSY